MSTSEVLQLCLVIIGICGLFIQVYNGKTAKRSNRPDQERGYFSSNKGG